MTTKPWDARIAYSLVRLLRRTGVTPNHLTSLRLLVGLSAATLFAVGSATCSNWAALLYILSNLLDHADGELARLTGKSSVWGHYYDLIADALVQTLLFTGIGYGLRDSSLGEWALPMGIISGVSVVVIFGLRMRIEDRMGKAAASQPSFAGFEIEDTLYLVAPMAWFGWLVQFLVLSVTGLSVFALLTVRDYKQQSF